MKTEKESALFKAFWFMLTASPMFGLVSLLILPLNFDIYSHLLISFCISILYAKNVIDKQDLKNKIFELKQLIEKKL